MTQENGSTSQPGAAPGDAAAGASKARVAAKKPATRKTAAKKTTPATESVPAAETETAPTKKPRATAKTTAKTATPKSTSAKTAKTPEDGAAPEKTPARPRRAAKPKTAPVKEEKAPTPENATAEQAPAEQTTAEKTPAKKAAAKKTPAAGKTTAKAKPARPAKAAKPAKAETTADMAASPVTENAAPQSTESSSLPPAAPRAETPKEPEPEQRAPRTTETVQESVQETAAAQEPAAVQNVVAQPAAAQEVQASETVQEAAREAESQASALPGETAEAPAKPASRRSRRGGRRRNKSRTAAAENGTAAEAPQTAADPAPREEEASPDARAARAKPASAKESPKASQTEKGGKKTGEKPKVPAKPEAKAEAKASDETGTAVEGKTSDGKRKMFISVLSGELVEVVLAEEGAVVEYYVEMQHQAKIKGNIYKGVVSNIDANLQAAFVSYAGGVKNGFLQIDEVHPEYYLAHHDPVKGRKYPPIQKVLKPGQEILVQVVKEPAGTKGAFLTSYLSLPGRFLVLTPGREQIGVSRKVDNDEERSRLRELLEGLKPGKDLGVIVRTVSTGAGKTSLQRDLQFLKRLWKDVRTRGQTASAPSLIYEELDLSTRAVRDYLTDDVQEVWVDDAATAGQVTELASLLFPKKQDLVRVHQDAMHSLFERFSLQKQLDQIHSREVSLPSGGSLVIDKTEALTAIDINSGRSGGKSNFEDMAYRTNLEAAKAIPLQLRLRDIGGQVVADFIEMRDREHWREVEKAVRAGMKGDRARYDVGKIGPFGMLEIVRQRLGSSAISISTESCPCCKGTGIRRNMEWQAMQALRDVGRQLRQASANNQAGLTYHADQELAFYLLNTKRSLLQSLETEAGVALSILPKTE